MKDISVIGPGSMGSALTKTLLDIGYRVTLWNRSIEKAESLKSAGAEVAESAAVAIAASPASIICIASHEQTTHPRP
jgi:3-hydroxyisobutyrate dehydrogenase-like beta-hydroxyacid dehydrogenase